MDQEKLSGRVREVIRYAETLEKDPIKQALILEVAFKQISATTQAEAHRQVLWNCLNPNGRR